MYISKIAPQIGKREDGKKRQGRGGKAFPWQYSWTCNVCGHDGNADYEETCQYCEHDAAMQGFTPDS